MSQSRTRSLTEAVFNTVVGYGINFTANLVILPHFGFDISIKQNIVLGLIYTLISIIRGYVIRRWFNFGDKSES